MITRGQLKQKVLTVLNRSGSVKGYNTDERLDQAIEEALDTIAIEMFGAGNGWLTQFRTYDITDGQLFLPIDQDVTLINEVAILVGSTVYVPMIYDEQRQQTQLAPGTVNTIAPYSYQIVDNKIYFSTGIAGGGTDYVRIKFTAYPQEIQNDTQNIAPNFDKSMIWLITYQAASVCAVMVGKPVPEWKPMENYWRDKVQSVLTKRNNQTKFIRNFA